MKKFVLNKNPDKNPSEFDMSARELDMKFHDTESGNRERFIKENKNKILYLPENKEWLMWKENRWERVAIAHIAELADKTAKKIYDEARDCNHSEGQKRLTRWAMKSQSKYLQNSMIEMASRSPKLIESASNFDTNPDLINCQNGTVDLKTGELISHSPQNRHLKITSIR